MPDPFDIRFIIPEPALRAVGVRAVAMIRIRTQAGFDADGRLFTPYSTKPFARPLAGITQRARAALGDRLRLFTTKQGRLWAIIIGGYKAFKQAAYSDDGNRVNLTGRGLMLGSLTVVAVNENAGTVRIGFTRQEEALKALYHNVIGAGKRRVIRRFLGLTSKERETLAEMLAKAIIILPGGR